MPARSQPETVSELYPSPWLHADDLAGHKVRATVATVALEEIRQRDGETVTKAVLSFVGKTKRLILNRTQCEAMASVTGSERFADWVGAVVVLYAGLAPNRKPTIIVERGPHE